MSKIKMRCASCGKWFQSANAKDTTCPDCTQKARREKLAAKTPPQAGKPTDVGTPRPAPPPPKPRPAGTSSSHWLDSLHDVKVGEPDQPPPRPKLSSSSAPRDNRGEPDRGGFRDRDRDRGPGGPGNYRERDGNTRGPGGPGNYRERDGNTRGPGGYREREGGYRGPGGYRENDYRSPGGYREGGYRVGGGMGLPSTIGQRPRQPMEGGPNRGPRPDKFRPGLGGKPKGQKPPKPPAPPRPKKEKTPPPPPFVPTPEQIAQVENRYIELATPTEFDGIRTQIAKELSIPKKAVKKIIKDLRDRQDIPSWWELQTYKGDEEELAKIKAAYEPLLPVPPVGVHKQIAEQLSLKPGVVYQAIKVIRQEMKLPQYNDPVLHGLEPSSVRKAKTSENGATPTESQAESEGEKTTDTGATPVENNTELQSESHGEITSIETDTEFHREGDTIEAGAASTDNATNAAPTTSGAEAAEQHPAAEAS